MVQSMRVSSTEPMWITAPNMARAALAGRTQRLTHPSLSVRKTPCGAATKASKARRHVGACGGRRAALDVLPMTLERQRARRPAWASRPDGPAGLALGGALLLAWAAC